MQFSICEISVRRHLPKVMYNSRSGRPREYNENKLLLELKDFVRIAALGILENITKTNSYWNLL